MLGRREVNLNTQDLVPETSEGYWPVFHGHSRGITVISPKVKAEIMKPLLGDLRDLQILSREGVLSSIEIRSG